MAKNGISKSPTIAIIIRYFKFSKFVSVTPKMLATTAPI